MKKKEEVLPQLGTTEKPLTCSICQDLYVGWGNNAMPVNEGRCCDDCNSMVVIPARIRIMRKEAKKP